MTPREPAERAMKYLLEVFWSDDDEGCIAVASDLPGCSAFGATPEAAVHEIRAAIEAWIAACRASGEPISGAHDQGPPRGLMPDPESEMLERKTRPPEPEMLERKTRPPEPRVKGLDAALVAAEGPAILRWIIDGCLAWQRQGLSPPASVKAATEDYISAEDVLAEWIAERFAPSWNRKPTLLQGALRELADLGARAWL